MLCRSPSSGVSSSSSDSCSSEEGDGPANSKRQTAKVDYVAMNSEMFGDEADDGSDQDYG